MTTNTKTVSTSSTVDSLIGALRSHLLGRTMFRQLNRKRPEGVAR